MAEVEPATRTKVEAGAGFAALAVAVLAVLLVCGAVVWLALRQTDGVLVYALDDPYIHMAIAKNLSENGTWGVNPGEFAGASSSPLWTLLLAGVYGVRGSADDATPLVLNLLAAGGAVVV